MVGGKWRIKGKCGACKNVDSEDLLKIYPSGLIAKYFQLRDVAWVCGRCRAEAEKNDYRPQIVLATKYP